MELILLFVIVFIFIVFMIYFIDIKIKFIGIRIALYIFLIIIIVITSVKIERDIQSASDCTFYSRQLSEITSNLLQISKKNDYTRLNANLEILKKELPIIICDHDKLSDFVAEFCDLQSNEKGM